MAAVKQDLTVAIKLNDQFSGGLKDIQRETSNTFDEGKSGSFLGGIKASTVALGAMAAAGIAAVGAGLKASFDLAREFEQSMADVSAITGATGDELQSLSDLARDMGATTAHSASAAAEGIQFLGMAGFDTTQIMDALPATLNLASAAGMELGAAADISSNILSGMGMNAGDLDGVVDKLAQTSRNANTDVGQLGEAFKMVGPTAGAAGMSFDDTTVSLGLLANAGLQGGIGGSSLNSALRSMISPSKEAAKEAEKLGLTFMDTNGKMLPMSNIMTQLEEKSVSTKQSFKIFGTEGARAINALRAQGVEAFTKLDKKIKESGGVAEDMAKTRLGSFDGAMKMLSSGMSEFGLSVGETFLPIVSKIVSDFLIPAVARTNEFIKSFGGIEVMFRDALTFIVGFKNTALNILHAFFTDASFAEDFLSNIGAIFSAALGVINSFAIGGSRVMRTMAFGTNGRGGMLGIISNLAKIIWAPLETGFLIIWDAIKIPLVQGVNFMAQIFTDGINSIIRNFNSLAEVIGVSIDEIDFTPLTVDAPRAISARWAEMGTDISDGLDAVGVDMEDLQTGISADMHNMKTDISSQMDKVTSAIAETANTASHLVDEGMKEVVEKYNGATETMKAEAPADGKAIGEGLAKPIVTAMDEAGEEVAAGFLSKMQSSMIDPESGMGKVLTNSLAGAINGNSFQDTVAGLGQTFGTMIGGPIGGAILGQVMGKLAEAKPKASERAEGALGSILQGFEAAGGDVSQMGGLEGELGGIFDKDTGKIKEKTAAGVLVGKLIKFGMSKDAAETLLTNILPKIRQGRGLGEKEVRLVNEALNNALVEAEARAIEERQRVREHQEGITERAEERLGITTAAHGYNGMVSEPTLFLAGEAGPEQVDITPSSRMSGGFSGSGGANFSFNFSVNTIDEQGVRSFIEEDAKPYIVQMLNRESTRGSTVMYSTGLTTDPSV